MKRLVALLLLLVAPMVQSREAMATKVCDRSVPGINQLIDFAQTACAPGRDGSGFSLMVITSQSALDTAFRRKAYLIIVVGAVGKALDDVGARDITKIVIMDRYLGAQGKFLSIPAKEVVRISRAVRADKFDSLDAMYAAIESSTHTEQVPPKK